ncbi:MAG: ATP-binding protein [Bacteroidota bacterium]
MSFKPSDLSLQVNVILAALIAIIYIAASFIVGHTIDWLVISFTVLGYFIFSYIIYRYTFEKYIIKQINLIYKTIFQVKKNGNLPAFNDKNVDLISEVKKQVQEWTTNKSKEIEDLKQLENYRKEFLGNVSHELKTPIFNIQGYVLTLLDGGLEDPSINKKYLQRTEKSIERLINIVKDLESISKLETGELELEYSKFNIISLVKEIFESLEIRANKKNIKLVFDNSQEKGIMVFADKLRITQVLSNLISNSINYGNENGTTSLNFHTIDDKILVEVSDNGIGIDQNELPRIFERFYRVDKSRSRDSGGTGLGLAIVKHIIDGHNQTLNVASEAGKGTTFSFTLNAVK